jgi:anti-anti-sigma factor
MNLWTAISNFMDDYYDAFGQVSHGAAGPDARRIFAEIRERASSDPKFRKKLLETPLRILKQMGFNLPRGFRLKFVEEDRDTCVIPIPAYVGELTDEESPAPQELQHIVQRTAMDAEFRQRFVEQPGDVLRDAGLDVPGDTKVVILENTDDLFFAVLPAGTEAERSSPKGATMRVEGDRVFLSGSLDAVGVEQVRDDLLALDGPLKLDMGGLSYLSSAGLSLLLLTYKKLQKSGHTMHLTRVPPPIRNVLVLSGFDEMLR